ncbi:hypothetical protein JOC77_003739 [Peribacillus deserti]|uniref:DUF3967 domain-containing protein n=1 Tax=Peribacillus deserti TaxID=673318 RepID=A0ABS2QM77_9BACI|nr:hypothetical protein [Peribacillus deserti]MBM7694278.1 hypothetical protein [Peribacillus deserti]
MDVKRTEKTLKRLKLVIKIQSQLNNKQLELIKELEMDINNSDILRQLNDVISEKKQLERQRTFYESSLLK